MKVNNYKNTIKNNLGESVLTLKVLSSDYNRNCCSTRKLTKIYSKIERKENEKKNDIPHYGRVCARMLVCMHEYK